jgi:hypothetical protein
MRRLAPLMLVAAALAACGGGGDDDDKRAPAPGSASTTPAGATTSRDRVNTNPRSGTTPANPRSEGGTAGSPASGAAPPPGASRGIPVGTVPPAGGPVADHQAVVRTVRAYLQAISRGNGAQACAQLTPEGRRFMERKLAGIAPETAGAPCQSSILLYQGAYGSVIRNPRVTGVRVNGNRARAVGPIGEVAVLRKSGRLWRISRYGQ